MRHKLIPFKLLFSLPVLYQQLSHRAIIRMLDVRPELELLSQLYVGIIRLWYTPPLALSPQCHQCETR